MEDGVKGFIVREADEAAEAVARVRNLSRARCREVFEKRFTTGSMANHYMNVYEQMLRRGATFACA
jgi:glycosyltransferase involved in cell wall biosynthesis